MYRHSFTWGLFILDLVCLSINSKHCYYELKNSLQERKTYEHQQRWTDLDLPVPSAFFFPEYFQASIACSFCASPLMITFLDTISHSGMTSISHCACSITHSLHKHRWVFYSSTFYSISLVEKLPRNLDRKPSKWLNLTIFFLCKKCCANFIPRKILMRRARVPTKVIIHFYHRQAGLILGFSSRSQRLTVQCCF